MRKELPISNYIIANATAPFINRATELSHNQKLIEWENSDETRVYQFLSVNLYLLIK